jgi:diguanylate cyclase
MRTANEIHLQRVHPVYTDLGKTTVTLAAREQVQATAALTELRRRQHALVPAAVVAGGAGIAALAVFLVVLVGYQRRLVRQAAASSHQALHDALTGLPNRELFADRVGQALRTADRELQPAALLLLDLDRFKDVNDTLGHHHGDQLLCEVGVRLQEALRQVDTVARLGGDEFGVLAPALPDWQAAVEVGQLVRITLARPLPVEELELAVTGGVGIALGPTTGLIPTRCCSAPTSPCTRPRRDTPGSRCTPPSATSTAPGAWPWSEPSGPPSSTAG